MHATTAEHLRSNGHHLTQEQQEACQEIDQQLLFNTVLLQKDRQQDAMLFHSVLEGWDYHQFIQVMQYRGRSYNMMLSLVDKWLEIQGYAMLRMTVSLAKFRITDAVMQKVIALKIRNRQRELHYAVEYAHDPELVRQIREVIGIANAAILDEFESLASYTPSSRSLSSG